MIGIWDYTVDTYIRFTTFCSNGNLWYHFAGAWSSLFWSIVSTYYVDCLILLMVRVARSKKNRTKKEKDFGVQIDSLSDLVAFRCFTGLYR